MKGTFQMQEGWSISNSNLLKSCFVGLGEYSSILEEDQNKEKWRAAGPLLMSLDKGIRLKPISQLHCCWMRWDTFKEWKNKLKADWVQIKLIEEMGAQTRKHIK